MKTIVGVFDDRHHAEDAVTALRALNINDTDISYVALDKKTDTVTTTDGAGDAAEGAVSGATTGGIIGAIAGLAVANGVLPGLGTLFVAGPIAAALGLTGAAATTAAGALTGAAAGGLIGALGSVGVDEAEAKVYEERIREGGVLVTAVVDSVDEAAAREVFDAHHAQEVRIYTK